MGGGAGGDWRRVGVMLYRRRGCGHTNPLPSSPTDEHPAAIHHKNGTSAAPSLHACQGRLPAASLLFPLALTLLFLLYHCDGGEALDRRVPAAACCPLSQTARHEPVPEDRHGGDSESIRLLSH